MKTKKAFSENYIPSVITASNIILGITALYVILSTGRLDSILPIILITAFLDFADGYLAGKLNAETRVGCVLDSIADLICFVSVPSLYIFMLNRFHSSTLLLLACIFYLLAGIARLVRYTTTKLTPGKGSDTFVGCPVTGAALCAVMAAGSCGNMTFHTVSLFVCGYLMVSRIKYTPISKIFNRHFRDAFFFIYIFLALPFLVFYPVKVIFALSFAYLMFFPINLLRLRYRFMQNRVRPAEFTFPIARDARGLIAICALLLLLSVLYLPLALKILYALILSVFVFFFRDPERVSVEPNESDVLSPADGRIIGVERVFNEDTKSFFNKVIIFLSILDAHINRAPLSLRILKREHRDGGNLDARHPEAGGNEHNFFTCEFAGGSVLLLKQIAGKLARRVVSYAEEGDVLKSGEKFGMILFGSRVELFLPEDIEILTKKGDVVRAGQTKIAIRK